LLCPVDTISNPSLKQDSKLETVDESSQFNDKLDELEKSHDKENNNWDALSENQLARIHYEGEEDTLLAITNSETNQECANVNEKD
jgi:hypothetical protein